jgi:hypothetical protein
MQYVGVNICESRCDSHNDNIATVDQVVDGC